MCCSLKNENNYLFFWGEGGLILIMIVEKMFSESTVWVPPFGNNNSQQDIKLVLRVEMTYYFVFVLNSTCVPWKQAFGLFCVSRPAKISDLIWSQKRKQVAHKQGYNNSVTHWQIIVYLLYSSQIFRFSSSHSAYDCITATAPYIFMCVLVIDH